MPAEPSLVERPIVPTGEYRASTRWSLLGPAHQALFGDHQVQRWWAGGWEEGDELLAARLADNRLFLDYALDILGLGSDDVPTLKHAVRELQVKATPLHTVREPGVGLAQWLDYPELRRATQRAAVEEFALSWGSHAERWQLPDDTYAIHGPALRVFLRAMYEETQVCLAELGIERLHLWRGMAPRGRVAPFRRVALDLQPLSSFTTRFDTAYAYAEPRLGQILLVDAPRERVIGTPWTGFGELPACEVVVLSAPGDAWALTWGSEAEKRRVSTEANIRRLAERYGRQAGRARGVA